MQTVYIFPFNIRSIYSRFGFEMMFDTGLVSYSVTCCIPYKKNRNYPINKMPLLLKAIFHE